MIINGATKKVDKALMFIENKKWEVENLDIPNPLSSNSYTMLDICYHNDKIYAPVKYSNSSTTYLYLYTYDGGNWSSVKVDEISGSSASTQAYIQELNGKIYILYSMKTNTTSGYWYFKKFENSTFTLVTGDIGSLGAGSATLVKDYDNNCLYVVYTYKSSSSDAYYIYFYNFNGSTFTKKQSEKTYTNYMIQGNSYIKDNFLSLSYNNMSNSNNYISVFNLSDFAVKSYRDFYYGYNNRLVKLNNGEEYLYHSGEELGKLVNCDLENIIKVAFTTCAYGNSILTYDTYNLFRKLRLYRTLTSYGKTDDIIQLSGETVALSNNLEKLDDNTYKVTEDGEIQIKVYE